VDRNGINNTFPLAWISTVLYQDRIKLVQDLYGNHPIVLFVSLYHLYQGRCEIPNGPATVVEFAGGVGKELARYDFGGKGKRQDRLVSQLFYSEVDTMSIRTVEFNFPDTSRKVITGCSYKTGLEGHYGKTIGTDKCLITLCQSHIESEKDIWAVCGTQKTHSCCNNWKYSEIQTIYGYGDFRSVDVL